jgi:hypothetical protein
MEKLIVNIENWEYLGINKSKSFLLIIMSIMCSWLIWLFSSILITNPYASRLFILPMIFCCFSLCFFLWSLFRFGNTSLIFTFYLNKESQVIILLGNIFLGNKPKIFLHGKEYRLIKILDIHNFKLYRYILVDLLQLINDPLTSVSIRRSPVLTWIIEHTTIGIDTRLNKYK